MNPLDRINQPNNEVALLRSQLSDARKQLEADSATIAKLAKDKQELVACLRNCADDLHMAAHTIRSGGTIAQRRAVLDADETSWVCARNLLSRHA